MNTLELFRLFESELERRNYSPRTVEDYRLNLQYLAMFLTERPAPSKVEGKATALTMTPTLASEFARWIYDRPTRGGMARGVANQNRILIQARKFFAFLKQEGYRPDNPAAGLELAREPETLPRNILTPAEAGLILDSINTSHVRGYRDRTLLEVFYATGLRSQELINLKVGDVNLEEELLRINGGKGAKDRVAPLSRVACRFLETYLKGIRPDLLHGRKTDRLFLSWRGRPLCRYNLAKLVQRYARQAGIRKRATCHVWRHSCATHLLKNNANLRHVQEILGHRRLSTTERYLHLNITDLKEAHRRFHPREKGVEEA